MELIFVWRIGIVLGHYSLCGQRLRKNHCTHEVPCTYMNDVFIGVSYLFVTSIVLVVISKVCYKSGSFVVPNKPIVI